MRLRLNGAEFVQGHSPALDSSNKIKTMRAPWDLETYHQVQGHPLALKPFIITSMGFSLLTSFHVSVQFNGLRKAAQIHHGFSPPHLIPMSPYLPAKHDINVHSSNKETKTYSLI